MEPSSWAFHILYCIRHACKEDSTVHSAVRALTCSCMPQGFMAGTLPTGLSNCLGDARSIGLCQDHQIRRQHLRTQPAQADEARTPVAVSPLVCSSHLRTELSCAKGRSTYNTVQYEML